MKSSALIDCSTSTQPIYYTGNREETHMNRDATSYSTPLHTAHTLHRKQERNSYELGFHFLQNTHTDRRGRWKQIETERWTDKRIDHFERATEKLIDMES